MNTLARTQLLVVALIGLSAIQAIHAEEAETAPAKSGLAPAKVRPEAMVTERELAHLLPRLAKRLGTEGGATINVTRPNAPVTRIRALMAAVRLAVEAEEIDSYRAEMPEDMPSDSAQVPLWGRPYLAAAVMRGWLRADTAFSPKKNANWRFLESVLSEMVHSAEQRNADQEELDQPERSGKSDRGEPGRRLEKIKYSGLVVDLGELKVERSMSPRILDEEGIVVYPDPQHLPDLDYVQDFGILTYDRSVETAKRAGNHPLVVKATRVSGAARTDVIVSKESAALILEANRAGKFLWKWAVSVVPGTVETRTAETKKVIADN
jgi:hypothetical protein